MTLLVTALLLGVGVYAAIAATRLGVWSLGEPGAGLFPLLFAGMLAGLSVLHLLRHLKDRIWSVAGGADAPILRSRRFAAYAGALTLYVATFGVLGFLISSILAFGLLMLVGERVTPVRAAAVLAGALATSYIVLQWLLGVPLPAGPFG
ncbi:tripartite tricarboxylate transporter TctB family protein [Vineibacter terrae]|uniref:Tripartite tricarboxylate transporter TctB family protein n=1 Tax=Vineibacter terrae TaxID=2586908 RepID=A0A5C8PIW3_9HYPH|nr:tripartite tricarboxylate transporter TctB family protein [Vineibacter terrae]TXL73457.1 tripartite tricarboxylate transporter TctB family protein [Vineibacter terrae]